MSRTASPCHSRRKKSPSQATSSSLINAEDPDLGFLPSPGTIDVWVPPQGAGIRIDTFVQPGTLVQPYSDSMIAKVITHAASRTEALDLMRLALARFHIEGVRTTKTLQESIISSPRFGAEPIHTRWLDEVFLAADEKEKQT